MYTNSDPKRFAHVRLACSHGIGPRTRKILLERFDSPEAIFTASPDELRAVRGIGKKLAMSVASKQSAIAAEKTIRLCENKGITILVEGDPEYPNLLSQIEDPPGILFTRGSLEHRPCLAIVGSRHATAYGLRMAEKLASDLVQIGYTVVSGLARGIDAAAHRGAIRAGGHTIAVLGNGILSIYPPEHTSLANDVMLCGAILSEFPPQSPPSKHTFPQRNRIISGLCLGTIVAQSSPRSGALITARLASEQGREVFAVPGPIDCPVSRGCHALIRDGAKLVESVHDVIDELGPLTKTFTDSNGRNVRHPAEFNLGPIEQKVIDSLEKHGDSSPISIDLLVSMTHLPPSQILATISVLEMRKLLSRFPGGYVAKT